MPRIALARAQAESITSSFSALTLRAASLPRPRQQPQVLTLTRPAGAETRRTFAVSAATRLAAETAPPAVGTSASAQSSSPSSSSSPATGDATPAAPAEPAKWTPHSRRVGLIARKKGMTAFFLPSGERVPVTVLQVDSNQVSAHIAPPTAAYTALQVAATDSRSVRGTTAQIRGHLRKAGITKGKKVIKEFKVTPDAMVPLGTTLSAAHFVPGQYVDVRGITRGKGFQGAMKRHGFHGLRASHGVSISHRSHGSTGQHQDPGRVFPGKKMAGRMGGTAHRTVHNLEVLRVDTRTDLLFVRGNVPGPEEGYITIADAKRAVIGRAAHAAISGKLPDGIMADATAGMAQYLPEGVDDLPFPAGTQELAQQLPEVVEAAPKAKPSS